MILCLCCFCDPGTIAEPYGKKSPRLPQAHSDRYNWEQVKESEPNQTLRAEPFEKLRVEVADEGFITA